MTGKRIFGYGHTVLSFFVPHDSRSGMLLIVLSHIEKGTWSQLLSLVPRCKAFALPIKSKRATRNSPTRGIYNTITDVWKQLRLIYVIDMCMNTPSWGVHVALFLTWWWEVAKFYTVKTKASRKRLSLYVCGWLPRMNTRLRSIQMQN